MPFALISLHFAFCPPFPTSTFTIRFLDYSMASVPCGTRSFKIPRTAKIHRPAYISSRQLAIFTSLYVKVPMPHQRHSPVLQRASITFSIIRRHIHCDIPWRLPGLDTSCSRCTSVSRGDFLPSFYHFRPSILLACVRVPSRRCHPTPRDDSSLSVPEHPPRNSDATSPLTAHQEASTLYHNVVVNVTESRSTNDSQGVNPLTTTIAPDYVHLTNSRCNRDSQTEKGFVGSF
jgi:hypothetical protein